MKPNNLSLAERLRMDPSVIQSQIEKAYKRLADNPLFTDVHNIVSTLEPGRWMVVADDELAAGLIALQPSWQSDVNKNVSEFRKQVEQEEPEFVRDCRLRFLTAEASRLSEELAFVYQRYHHWTEQDVDYATKEFMLMIYDADGNKALLSKIEKRLAFMKSGTKREGGITDEQIAAAREYPIAQILAPVRGNMVRCPFHGEDKHPSMSLHNNRFHCFTCGVHGDTIELVMKLHRLDFVNAVKYLAGGGS